MFAASKTSTPSAVGPDPQFNYVTMLLHGDGTNGAQNNTFLDSSTNNFTITRNGNTTQGSFSPYGSNWSNYFNGSSGYLSTAGNSSLNFGGNNFTVEFWINTTQVTSTITLVTKEWGIAPYTGGWTILLNGPSGGNMTIYWADFSTSATFMVANTTAYRDGAWHHVAWVRNGSSFVLYIDGVSVATATNSTAFGTNTNQLTIGGEQTFGSGARSYIGYMSNLRIVNGTPVYTSAFTPPTAPLTAITNTKLLTCADNRFIDDSTNNFAFTVAGTTSVQRFNPFGTTTAYSTSVIGGSMYSPSASGNYLSIPNDAAFTLGSTFTVECWVYRTGGDDGTIVGRWYAGNSAAWLMHIAGGYLAFGLGTGSYANNSSIQIPINAWSHLAVSNDATSKRLYINGVLVGTYASDNVNSLGSLNLLINQNTGGGNGMPIYISDLRIVKGTAVYTSAFVPPTAPVTAITNTVLLTNMTNGAIFDNAMMTNLETVGNAQISTSVVKYGSGSLAFDGTGDYLKLLYTPNLNFSSNFTVECWVNATSKITNFPTIVNNYSTFASNGGFAIFASHNSGTVGKYQVAFNGVFPAIQSTTSISYGTWQHIALVRSGSTLTLYVDGVANGTSSSSADVIGTANNWWIGTAGDDLTNGYLNGYIDDLRITKGYARYTANFTPPTAAFSNTGPY